MDLASPRWESQVRTQGSAKGRRTAFTLVELLVVVAIIAILAAILFPVFTRARQKANQTTCTSNLKQLGAAVAQYTQDNDEDEPISEYMNGTCAETAQASLMPYLKSTQLLVCPGSTASFNLAYIMGILSINACPDVPTVDNYALNNSVIPNSFIVGFKPVALATLTNPSETVAAYDGNLSGLATNFQWDIQAVHNGTANLMFADGHVKDIPTTEGAAVARYDNPPTSNTITTYTMAANSYGCSGQTTCQVLAP